MENNINKETLRHEIIFNKATERAFTWEYWDKFDDDIYLCHNCKDPLFYSKDKFKSSCGWPSFDDAIPGKVELAKDADGFRTESICKNCMAHLWHIFIWEHMTQKNTRYCMNSLALDFISKDKINNKISNKVPLYNIIYLWWGCFWCTEWALKQAPWILEIRSGYMWWHLDNPTYERVCSGISGYIEIVEVFFNPDILDLETLLTYFFEIHDATSIDKQWYDVGSQYRSAIFTTWKDQKDIVNAFIQKLDKSWVYDKKIITEVRDKETFYIAEDYHKNYYKNNQDKPYCKLVIRPKIEKIKKLLEIK